MPQTRVNEIDLLRFFAALSVVFYHYAFRGHAADGLSAMPYPLLAPVAQYGFLGVHLFFMISGFVILMTASRGGVADFAISRAVRLYPAFWVCCTLTFIGILAFGNGRFSASWPQYFANMTLVGNFLSIKPIDGVYWSLIVELRFYALVFLVLALRQIGRTQLLLTLWLVASAALQALPPGKLQTLLISDYAALFIGGAVAYLIHAHGPSPSRLALFGGAWGLALYQASIEIGALERHFGVPFSLATVDGIICLFFIIMLGIAMRRSGWFGRQRWLMAGAITYPLYLLHQNLGYLLFNAAYPEINPHLLLWGTTASALLLALAVHLLGEKPLAGLLKKWLFSMAQSRSELTPPQSSPATLKPAHSAEQAARNT
jgi:peptidoglycan/LPS O-acetylase OafA/YrhL